MAVEDGASTSSAIYKLPGDQEIWEDMQTIPQHTGTHIVHHGFEI